MNDRRIAALSLVLILCAMLTATVVMARPSGPDAGMTVEPGLPESQPPQIGRTSLAIPSNVDPNPLVQSMIDGITATTLYSYTGDLSGEWPVLIGGEPYTLVTRHTDSSEPIDKATQFVYERLANLGLDATYHQWQSGSYSGRNVIGQIDGALTPDKILILCAHVDDMPPGPLAPGADDNASGVVAVLMAAELMSQYHWGPTLRFALWTGEEQGLLGSGAYAQRASNLGEDIIGVLNLDMIAWDALGDPDIDLHASESVPDSLDLSSLFVDVVDEYDLELVPDVLTNGTGASDHASFWTHGYPAILAIEDYYPNKHDFNPDYHTVGDDLDDLNMAYYTEFVRAAVGTFGHMAGGPLMHKWIYLPLTVR